MKNIPILVTLLTLSACVTGTVPEAEPGVTSTTELIAADLTDPSVAAELGSPPFSEIGWQRIVGPYTVVGDTQLPDATQLTLMEAAVSDLPPFLGITPRNLIRTSVLPNNIVPISEHAVAAAAGPDIYLLDPVFAIDGSTTRIDLTYAIMHELVHVSQWYSLDPAYTNAALRGEFDRLDLTIGSLDVAAFARATGWMEEPDGSWSLDPNSRPVSDYAMTGPVEDMAETVAWAVVGRTDWLDADHQTWLESWIDVPLTTLATGMPWSPTGSSELFSASPLFDEVALRAAAAARRATHIEPTYFLLPNDIDQASSFSAVVTEHLTARQLTGSLELVTDDRLPRYSGLFERSDGVAFWVELWDFRGTDISEIDSPVLAYVALWD